MSARRELAASMALRTIVPLLAIVPVARAARRGSASRAGSRRSSASPPRVGERSPGALAPARRSRAAERSARRSSHALNGLLDAARSRARRAARVHRRRGARAAHAAHRRAPAGAARRARNAPTPSAARRWPSCAPGSTRATHLVEQLLTLAREEPGVSERPLRAGQPRGARARGASPNTRRSPPRAAWISAWRAATPTAGDADASSTATPPRCARCVSNLVDNAVRYTPAGGRVDVAVAARRRRRACSTVRDSGPGIPASERERVFDRFYRVAGARRGGRARQRPRPRDRQAHRRAPRRDDRARAGLSGPGGEGLGVTVRLPVETGRRHG